MTPALYQILFGRRRATGPFDAINASNPIRCMLGARLALGTYTGSAYTLTRMSDSSTRTFSVGTLGSVGAAWSYALGACIVYVTQFVDITGNSTTIAAGTTGAAGTAPTVDFSQGAYPVFFFNGTSNRVVVSGLLDYTGTGKTLMTISAAFRATAAIAATKFIWFFSTFASGTTSRLSIGTTGTPTWLPRWLRTDGGSTVGNVVTGTPDQLPHVITQQIDTIGNSTNGTTQSNIDGTSNTAVTFASLPTGHSEGNSATVTVGGNTGNFWTGEINSVIAMESKPSLTVMNAAHVAYNANPPEKTLSIDETAYGGIIQMPTGIIFGKIFQADEGAQTRTITVKGKWRGTATKIQVRLRDAITLVAVGSVTDLDASPSAAGTYTGTKQLPAYGMYQIGVSTSDDPSTVVWSVSLIGCGENGVIGGQSNGSKFVAVRNSVLSGQQTDADLNTRRFSGATPVGWYVNDLVAQPDENITSVQGLNGTWGGEGVINLCNQFWSGSGIPIGVICAAINSTTSASWNPSGGSSYANMLLMLNKANCGATEFSWFIYDQLEANAVSGGTGAAWITDVTALEAALRTLCGRTSMKFGIVVGCQDVSATDVNFQEVKVNGQMKYIADNTSGKVFWAGYRGAQPWNSAGGGGGDDTHHSPNMYGSFGRLYSTGLLKQFSLATYGADGPQFTSITASATGQTVTFHGVLDGGTRIVDSTGSTGGAGVTGIRVLVNGVLKTATSTAFSGTTDLVATFAGGTFVNGDAMLGGYNWGKTNGLNAIYDNNAVPGESTAFGPYQAPGRPMKPTYATGATPGMLSCTAGA